MAASTVQARHRKSFVQRNATPLVFVALGVVVLIAALVLAASVKGESGAEVFDFTLDTPSGGSVTLADYRGKTVAVNFWATWCPPCRAEMPALDEYYRAHMDDDFVLLAVNVGEPAELAQSFIEQNGFTFPVALDPDRELAHRIGASGYPTTLVISPAGRIVYRHTGIITPEILDAKVREARGG